MHYKRPSSREIAKRLNEAKEFFKNRCGIFANPSKAVGELYELDIGDANSIWQLIRELLEEIYPNEFKIWFLDSIKALAVERS